MVASVKHHQLKVDFREEIHARLEAELGAALVDFCYVFFFEWIIFVTVDT